MATYVSRFSERPGKISNQLNLPIPQNFCTAKDFHTCPMERANDELGCMESCTGLYADVVHTPKDKLDPYVRNLMEEYLRYKSSYARNIKFDPAEETLGWFFSSSSSESSIRFYPRQ